MIFRELLRLLFVLFVATFVTFSMLYTDPDTVAEDILIMRDMMPNQEDIEAIKNEYGLNKPFLLQYTRWIESVSRGDFGYSHSLDKPVVEEFLQRLPNTLMLSVYSITFLIFFSLLFGILAATYKGSIIDKGVNILSAIAISIPTFWMGLILILIFIVHFRLFELTNMNNPKNILLPAISLALPLIGRYAILIRATFLDQLDANYITGAKIRGVSSVGIVFRHILPNAIVAILPPLGISIGAILGGTVIIETVFGIHGIGNMVIAAIDHTDYPIIKSFVLFMTSIYLFMSFSIDWLSKLIDPRLRQ